ncbi:MAG: D-alanine--D-alanine ligase [Alphaproteobacteria bacterium]|nr:D-alanine--D-alanine ligase [Alphaproteobacteria bacterium]MBO5441014.1 D-alanine--D-alanine ligase [Alphaproteobacteria bacterium]MBP3686866.1 D-alanine--D-alanine ligase [Alphaproteobacteria bacterium]
MTKKVMVLMGGFSSEREVSLNSGKAVAAALKQKGYDVIEHDLTDSRKLIEVLNKEKPDVVFNALHGNWGEDGTIPALLDLLQIPYTHSGLTASCVGMNKYLTKLIAEKANIKTAFGRKMTAREFITIGATVARPFVVKPVSDGSSVGVFIVEKPEDIFKIRYDDPTTELIVEKYIPGQELTVMCYQGKAHVVTEMKAKEGFYDYQNKYTSGKTMHIIPANIPDDVAKLCLSYAETIHNKLGCKTVSRSDFRYNPEDGVVFLEINTHPGMTDLSLVPEQAKYIGVSYEDLCASLVEEAQCRPLSK